MKKPQKIMIPIDFSSVAINAVRYADGILENQLAEVILVYVNTYDYPRTEQEIKRAFKTFQMEALKGVKFHYEFELLNGNLLLELINASKRDEVDLLIIGTKANKLTDLSLSTALIRSLLCPVILVPEHFTVGPLRKIAYVNDYQPIQESKAIKPLWEFAMDYEAKVYLLHINLNKKEELVQAGAAESTLEYYLESLDHEYVYLCGNDVRGVLNQFLIEKNIDLLVILSRDHKCSQLESEERLIAQLTDHAVVPILALC